MTNWREFVAERERFERWDAHWKLVYDRLFQEVVALGAVTVFAPLFGASRVGLAALGTQFVTFWVWRLVARHRFRGWDRWIERLRELSR